MKKVIIVGATSGIGRELAKLFALNKDMVCATGRTQELLNSLATEFPANILTECFDVTQPDNITHIERCIRQLGGLDLLIYNSGYGEPADNLDWTIDNKTNQINVVGFTEIVNYAFNYFVKQGQGQIAATSSLASIRGNSFAPAYSASKAYMSTYMEGLYIKAYKLKLPLHITDIQPGFVQTKMAKGNGQFWVAPVSKAAGQIFTAIQHKKRRAYITRRWWLIAQLMKCLPIAVYKRIG